MVRSFSFSASFQMLCIRLTSAMIMLLQFCGRELEVGMPVDGPVQVVSSNYQSNLQSSNIVALTTANCARATDPKNPLSVHGGASSFLDASGGSAGHCGEHFIL
jgi:hypothetical protein